MCVMWKQKGRIMKNLFLLSITIGSNKYSHYVPTCWLWVVVLYIQQTIVCRHDGGLLSVGPKTTPSLATPQLNYR